MQVYVIYNPNSRGAEVCVHKIDCVDIRKDSRGATSAYATAGESQQDIAADFWADFIDEGSMTVACAMGYTEFLPCTRGLPESAPGSDRE